MLFTVALLTHPLMPHSCAPFIMPGNCGIGVKGALALAAELAGSQLETLDLSKSNPFDLDLAAKLMAPSCLTLLWSHTCLTTDRNKIGDAGATEIAKHLKKDNQVTVLKLGK